MMIGTGLRSDDLWRVAIDLNNPDHQNNNYIEVRSEILRYCFLLQTYYLEFILLFLYNEYNYCFIYYMCRLLLIVELSGIATVGCLLASYVLL